MGITNIHCTKERWLNWIRLRLLSVEYKIEKEALSTSAHTRYITDLEGFSYAMSLHLNMGYYHIRLSDEASDMCTIVTKFGLFKYKRMPMGIKCSPDIFQSKIFNLLGDIEGTKAYINDILVVKKGLFQ